MDSILNWVTYIPLIGAVIILFFMRDPRTIRTSAALVALVDLVASLYLWYGFDPKATGTNIFQFRWTRSWGSSMRGSATLVWIPWPSMGAPALSRGFIPSKIKCTH